MATETLEERVATLEAEVMEMKARINAPNGNQKHSTGEIRSDVVGRTRPDFLDRVFGMYANKPDALEVLQTIEAERERERAEARHEAESETTQ